MKNNNNKRVLFIGCNHDQLPYLEELKARNYFIIGLDKNNNAPGYNLCNKFYNVGYDDIESMIEIGQAHSFGPDDKIFTAAAQFAHKGAASFASQFGCTYPKEDHIDSCLDKVSYYKQFKEIGVPIPLTLFIQNKDELDKALQNLNPDSYCYLKSDYSKNPNYVYRFKVSDYQDQNIFWGKDRYLRNYYILQEEFLGTSLRFNLYGNRFNTYDFVSGNKVDDCKIKNDGVGIIQSLKKIRSYYGMDKWLLKFDVILNKDKFVVLDIGMDPPYRMNKTAKDNKINFASCYLDQYLDGLISYPILLD